MLKQRSKGRNVLLLGALMGVSNAGLSEVVDDDSAVLNGAWERQEIGRGSIGGAYLQGSVESGSVTASWLLPTLQPGVYELRVRWPNVSGLDNTARYEITHALGLSEVALDQGLNQDQWNVLGRFRFDVAGGSVSLLASEDAVVAFDALEFEAVCLGAVDTGCLITTDGFNVGIGTAQPSSRLDVDGAISIGGVPIISEQGEWLGVSEGPRGPRGPTGPRGPRGPRGPGPEGPQGPQGERGAVGPVGAQGEQGLTGATGPAGPAGPQGERGAVGPVGAQGPQGERGLTGATGPVGPAGPQGARGLQGVRGLTGPQGAQGPQGPAGTPGTFTCTTRTTDIATSEVRLSRLMELCPSNFSYTGTVRESDRRSDDNFLHVTCCGFN